MLQTMKINVTILKDGEDIRPPFPVFHHPEIQVRELEKDKNRIRYKIVAYNHGVAVSLVSPIFVIVDRITEKEEDRNKHWVKARMEEANFSVDFMPSENEALRFLFLTLVNAVKYHSAEWPGYSRTELELMKWLVNKEKFPRGEEV